MYSERSIPRRRFLRACAAGSVALGAGRALIGSPAQVAAPFSRVVVTEDPQLRSGAEAKLDPIRVRALLDRSITALFDMDAPCAWAALFRPGECVGLKVNTLGGRGLSTSVAVVEAICACLQQAGIRASDIIVWDRDTAELRRAGFQIRMGGDGVQCFGTDRVGYEDDLSSFGSVGSRVSRILTRRCDALINVPVLKDHDGAGVSIALKNMFGAIHNPNKYHPNFCDPYVADVNMLPEIRSRLRLTVCDATSACFHGGPAFKPEFTWRHNALMVSRDAVALDTVGWHIIERKRMERRLNTLLEDGRAPRYLSTAADDQHRLGADDMRKIKVVENRMT